MFKICLKWKNINFKIIFSVFWSPNFFLNMFKTLKKVHHIFMAFRPSQQVLERIPREWRGPIVQYF